LIGEERVDERVTLVAGVATLVCRRRNTFRDPLDLHERGGRPVLTTEGHLAGRWHRARGAECETSAASTTRSKSHVATVLDKELKRRITVDGDDYTVAIDSKGIRLVGKGKRTPEVDLRWRDLLSGEAAMAVALNASLSTKPRAPAQPATEQRADRAKKPATKRQPR
jgi:hypothetical protein